GFQPIRGAAELDDRAFLLLSTSEGLRLLETDGSAAGTQEVVDFSDLSTSSVSNLESNGERLFFIDSPAEDSRCDLWTSDGTAAGTRLLGTIRLEDSCSGNDHDITPVVLGGSTLILSEGSSYPTEIWRFDSAEAGLDRVRADLADRDGFDPSGLVVWNGTAYFLAGEDRETPDGTTRFSGLWSTDGTAAGTAPVQEFPARRLSGEIVRAGASLFFVLDDGVHGAELWRSDGTAEGTTMVQDLDPGYPGFITRELTPVGDSVYFVARDSGHGIELWKATAGESGARLVHDLRPGPDSSQPKQLTVVGDKLFFTADDGLTGRELWVLPLDSSGPPCRASEEALCLQRGRFRVEVEWRDFQGRVGNGQAVPLTADTGYFWFFNEENVEAILKVLDGRPNNGHFWSFYGALSNVEYNLTVTDSETGLTRRYYNPARNFASVGDTQSFGPLGANSTSSPGTWVGEGLPLGDLAAADLDLNLDGLTARELELAGL
ncbi:MAG: hypothetical protein KDD47_25700, partial [Acidobacteria bacterium]|nr:hypothetical protein [Acidobacteriota bacterium]